tara:strand:+ start:1117 stop:1338 length:222 start_codon:yes stop_codon:yes gene_type:complete
MTSPYDDYKRKQKEQCHERVTSMTQSKANEMVDRTLGILKNCAVPKDYFKDVERMIDHFENLKSGNTVYVEKS